MTGDQIDFNGALDGWNNWANWGYKPRNLKKFSRQETLELENRLSEMYKDCHNGYCVPYAETPGNHDVTPPGKLLKGSGIDSESHFRQRLRNPVRPAFMVFPHGRFLCAPARLGQRSASSPWAARDYAEASRDPAVKYRLIGEHYHTKWDGAPTGNYAFTKGLRLDGRRLAIRN